eukprot:542672_1
MGIQVIQLLCDKVGIAEMLRILTVDIDNKDRYITNLTAKTLVIVGTYWGIDKFLPFLKAVCEAKECAVIRHTGITVIKELLFMENSDKIYPYLHKISELLPQNRKYIYDSNHNDDRQAIGSIMFIKSLNKFVMLGKCSHDDIHGSDEDYQRATLIQYSDMNEKNKKLSDWVYSEWRVPIPGRCICPNSVCCRFIDTCMDSIIAFEHFIYIFRGGFNDSISIEIIDMLLNNRYQHQLPLVVPISTFYVLKRKDNANIRFVFGNNTFKECSLFDLIPNSMKTNYRQYNNRLICGYIKSA